MRARDARGRAARTTRHRRKPRYRSGSRAAAAAATAARAAAEFMQRDGPGGAGADGERQGATPPSSSAVSSRPRQHVVDEVRPDVRRGLASRARRWRRPARQPGARSQPRSSGARSGRSHAHRFGSHARAHMPGSQSDARAAPALPGEGRRMLAADFRDACDAINYRSRPCRPASGRLAVGGDLGDRQRVGVELAVAGNRRVDGDAGADRIFVVGIGVDLLRLFAGQPLDQLHGVGLVRRVLGEQHAGEVDVGAAALEGRQDHLGRFRPRLLLGFVVHHQRPVIGVADADVAFAGRDVARGFAVAAGGLLREIGLDAASAIPRPWPRRTWRHTPRTARCCRCAGRSGCRSCPSTSGRRVPRR